MKLFLFSFVHPSILYGILSSSLIFKRKIALVIPMQQILFFIYIKVNFYLLKYNQKLDCTVSAEKFEKIKNVKSGVRKKFIP